MADAGRAFGDQSLALIRHGTNRCVKLAAARKTDIDLLIMMRSKEFADPHEVEM